MIKPFKMKQGGTASYTIIDLGYKFYLPPVESEGPFSSCTRDRPEGGYFYPAVAIYTGGTNFPADFTLLGSESEKDVRMHSVEVSWLEVLVNTGRTRRELTRIVKKHSKLLQSSQKDPRYEDIIAEFNWDQAQGGEQWKAEWREWREGQNNAK